MAYRPDWHELKTEVKAVNGVGLARPLEGASALDA